MVRWGARFQHTFGTENGLKTNTQTVSYGPVFSYRKNKTFVPFAHAMVGAVAWRHELP